MKLFRILVPCGVIVCCLLGYWQIERYSAKKNLLKAASARREPAENFAHKLLPDNLAEFKHVIIQGKYQNRMTVLVQNKIYAGKQGMEVFTPFYLDYQVKGQQKLLFIDRGWLAQKKISTFLAGEDQSARIVRGHIKKINQYQFMLGKNIIAPADRPLVVQKMDIRQISKLFSADFYPFVLRLDPDMPDGFIRDWQVVTLLPQQHLAYAIQWFLLAVVLSILSIWFVMQQAKR